VDESLAAMILPTVARCVGESLAAMILTTAMHKRKQQTGKKFGQAINHIAANLKVKQTFDVWCRRQI